MESKSQQEFSNANILQQVAVSVPQLTAESLRAVGAGNFFRPRDAAELGLGSRDLRRLIEKGRVERVGRGLYRLADAEPTVDYSLAAVCARAPKGIVCLLSALRVHELGTQLPRQVWIAIPHKARVPLIPEFSTRVVRFTGVTLRYGVEKILFEGVPARITNPGRTVVDCFRLRRLVGHDVAYEALRDALYQRKATADEIWRAAEVCRARSLLGPALEAISA